MLKETGVNLGVPVVVYEEGGRSLQGSLEVDSTAY